MNVKKHVMAYFLIGLMSVQVYINVSSILALQPLTTWGHYCGGKAARYGRHQVNLYKKINRQRFILIFTDIC
jgi:hypothetical protein